MNNAQLNQKTGLTFRRAYYQMLNGKKIKRPTWKGYWAFENTERGMSIIMHTMEGDTIDIRDTINVRYTFDSRVAQDWEFVDESEDKE